MEKERENSEAHEKCLFCNPCCAQILIFTNVLKYPSITVQIKTGRCISTYKKNIQVCTMLNHWEGAYLWPCGSIIMCFKHKGKEMLFQWLRSAGQCWQQEPGVQVLPLVAQLPAVTRSPLCSAVQVHGQGAIWLKSKCHPTNSIFKMYLHFLPSSTTTTISFLPIHLEISFSDHN